MANKQKIDGVSRELLERIAAEPREIDAQVRRQAAVDELRALLDKPAYPNRLCHSDPNAHPYLCGCLKGYAEAQRRFDEHHGKAAQHQGEPVAWRYKKSWEKTGWKVCDKHPTDYGIDDDCYEIQALYAEQHAPVAGQAQCEECKGWGYHENHHEGGGTECGECGGSGNATVAVAVVMPDRMKVEPFTTIDRGSKNYKAGYNAAIAEVAKLNGLKT